MNFEDIEDMLFSVPDSQESSDNLWNEDSNDEMLDVADNDYESDDDLFDTPVEVRPDTWQLFSSPEFTAAEASGSPHDNMALGDSCKTLVVNEGPPVDVGKRVPRDRCYTKTCEMEEYANLEQTLGHSPCRSYAGKGRRWPP